jgi:hypothetical protein
MIRTIALLLLVTILGCAHTQRVTHTSWQGTCTAALHDAQTKLTAQFPGFANGTMTVIDKPPRAIHLEMLVPDKEHARFYGAPAKYTIDVLEKHSDAPGELGGMVGDQDSQASSQGSRQTTERVVTWDVEVAEGPMVTAFQQAFDPAINACLK